LSGWMVAPFSVGAGPGGGTTIAGVRALVQRVRWAHVDVAGERVGEIGPGLCALIGVTHGDGPPLAARMATKIARLRVFDDSDGVMNRSLLDTGGEVLVVSQFTLYGDTTRGRRPSWIEAARPGEAEPIIDLLVEELASLGVTVATGRFRADMDVCLCNDGPVTLMLEL